jgi:hypothetical protein
MMNRLICLWRWAATLWLSIDRSLRARNRGAKALARLAAPVHAPPSEGVKPDGLGFSGHAHGCPYAPGQPQSLSAANAPPPSGALAGAPSVPTAEG